MLLNLYMLLLVFPHLLMIGVLGGAQQQRKKAQEFLRNVLERERNTRMAKNVVMFIGDGMSLATIAAARILKGQRQGRSGISEKMIYEDFPNIGLSRTSSINKYVPDSAATATAFLCGVKTKQEFVAVSDETIHSQCSSVRGHELHCMGEWFLAEGKSVGFVTNMRVTHATLAPLYSHVPDRWWEYDGKIPEKERVLCKDIARQLVEDYPGRKLQVVLGGGRESFMPNTTFDPEYPEIRGKRVDNKPLVDYWKKHKEANKFRHQYVWNKKQFDDVDPKKIDYLLGLFERSHMYDVFDRDEKKLSDFKEPTLAEMTTKAIQVLSKNPRGFFLLVEGGLIDHKHHKGQAVRAVNEALDMEYSVEVALNLTSSRDTLIVVTSDHSQALIFAGYANAGDDLFGIADISNADKMPYTTLVYSSGPGYSRDPKTGGRENITNKNTAHKDYLQQAVFPRSTSTHSAEDVGVYATGPMGHLFTGVYDQNYIAHAIAYASCVGSNKEHCEELSSSISCANANTATNSIFIRTIAFLWTVYVIKTALL